MMQTIATLIKAKPGDFEIANTHGESDNLQVRCWLNPPGAGSHAHAILSHTDALGSYTELSIADCSRHITLDFRASTKEEIAIARYKLKQLSSLLGMIDNILDKADQNLIKKIITE